MNYEDELERAKARRSRKRQNQNGSSEDTYRDSDYESTTYRNSRSDEDHGDRSSRRSTGTPSGGDADYDRASSDRERSESYDRASRRSGRPDASKALNTGASRSTKKTETWSGSAEPGSRASRMGGSSSGYGKGGGRKKKAGRTKKIIIGVIVGILAVVLALGIGAYAYIRYNFGRLQTDKDFEKSEVQNINIPEADRQRMEKGYWTIAVFGVDSRDDSLGSGNQSDVIMIVNLNRETGEIQLVSVFRDTYLNINDKNTYNKINAAYAQGGPTQAVKAINKNLDLNITHYATFNWKAVATAINILGGIDVDISKSEFYYINAFITETVKGTGIGSVQLKSAGLNHLDGVQAVAYARLRLMDTDYARTERQRLVVEKAFEKAKSANLATLNSLVGNMFAMTMTNINELDILPMVTDVNKYHLGETSGFPAARDEKKIKIGSRAADCVIPQTLESNVKSLHKFLFGVEDYTPTSTVQTISKKISDVSGLYNAGKEIDHVPTDQGYVPKRTTAAATAAATTEEEETVESSEGETSAADSTVESSTDIFGNVIPGESSSAVPSGPADASTDANGYPVAPTNPSYGYPTEPSTNESRRPSSPADMATMETTEGFGPGSEPTTAPVTIPEATTASPVTPGSESSSSIIVPSTTEQNTQNYNSPAQSTTAPVSPAASATAAPTTGALSPGNTQGPASAPTTGNAEAPGAGM